MKRLLTSSKFQACAAGIAACILVVFFGVSEESADEYVGLLLKLITGLAGVYAVTAAAEDVASKIGGATSATVTRSGGGVTPVDPIPDPPASPSISRPADFTRGSMTPVLLLFLLLTPLLIGGPGCSFLAPGKDIREAAESRSLTTWDTEDNLAIEESTTHNRRTVAAESSTDTVEAEYYADGAPKRISGASHLLTQWSEPKDVTGAYIQLANLNAQIGMRMLDLTDRLLAALPGGGGAATAVVTPAETDGVTEEVEEPD